MPISVTPGFDEDVADIIIPALTSLLSVAFIDEAGNAATVPVRSAYSDESAGWPEVTVAVELGDMPFGFGLNAQGLDPATGNTRYGFMARDSSIVCTVSARSDPERRNIASALMSGIPTAVVPASDGTPIAAGILVYCAQHGVKVTGMRRPQYPDPSPDEARPEAPLTFRAIVTVRADLELTWVQTADAGPTIAITNILAPDPTIPPIMTDAPFTVTGH